MAVAFDYDGRRIVSKDANVYQKIGRDCIKQLGPFCLGCRMSLAPAAMVDYPQFVDETGWGVKEYKQFLDGISFDHNLRRQLGEKI